MKPRKHMNAATTPHSPVTGPPSPVAPESGFTILEMLVATGVLAVMVSILFGLFAQGSAAWRHGERQSDLNQTARLALDIFARDAMMAVIDTNQPASGLKPMPGLCVTIRTSPSGGQPSPASSTQYGSFSDIFFVAPTTLGNQAANNNAYRALCGIRYYVAQTTKSDGGRSDLGQLIRTLYRSNTKTSGGSGFSLYNTKWWESGQPDGTTTTNAVLAENVLSFRIQPLQSNATYYTSQGLAPAAPAMFKNLTGDKDHTINYIDAKTDYKKSYQSNPGLIVGMAVVDRRLADRINEVGLKQAAEGRDFLVKTNWVTVFFGSYGP